MKRTFLFNKTKNSELQFKL
jgi:hypothetical protein